MAGIIKPDSGEILLNNKPFNNYDNKQWFQYISYVDQDPFIMDGTILDNICLGISKKDIDKNLLNKSIEIAQQNLLKNLNLELIAMLESVAFAFRRSKTKTCYCKINIL